MYLVWVGGNSFLLPVGHSSQLFIHLLTSLSCVYWLWMPGGGHDMYYIFSILGDGVSVLWLWEVADINVDSLVGKPQLWVRMPPLFFG